MSEPVVIHGDLLSKNSVALSPRQLHLAAVYADKKQRQVRFASVYKGVDQHAKRNVAGAKPVSGPFDFSAQPSFQQRQTRSATAAAAAAASSR